MKDNRYYNDLETLLKIRDFITPMRADTIEWDDIVDTYNAIYGLLSQDEVIFEERRKFLLAMQGVNADELLKNQKAAKGE